MQPRPDVEETKQEEAEEEEMEEVLPCSNYGVTTGWGATKDQRVFDYGYVLTPNVTFIGDGDFQCAACQKFWIAPISNGTPT